MVLKIKSNVPLDKGLKTTFDQLTRATVQPGHMSAVSTFTRKNKYHDIEHLNSEAPTFSYPTPTGPNESSRVKPYPSFATSRDAKSNNGTENDAP